jgi:hypothetical protein
MEHPSKFHADDLRRIRDKMRTGAIHWVRLTPAQRAELADEIEDLRETGAMKKRKPCSDKDKPRGPRTKNNKTTESTTAASTASLPPTASHDVPAQISNAPLQMHAAVPDSTPGVAPHTAPNAMHNTAPGVMPAPNALHNAAPGIMLQTAPATQSPAATASPVFLGMGLGEREPAFEFPSGSFDLFDFSDVDFSGLAKDDFANIPGWQLNTTNRDESWGGMSSTPAGFGDSSDSNPFPFNRTFNPTFDTSLQLAHANVAYLGTSGAPDGAFPFNPAFIASPQLAHAGGLIPTDGTSPATPDPTAMQGATATGPSTSVFSIITNTDGSKKRKRTEDGGEKPLRKMRSDKNKTRGPRTAKMDRAAGADPVARPKLRPRKKTTAEAAPPA